MKIIIINNYKYSSNWYNIGEIYEVNKRKQEENGDFYFRLLKPVPGYDAWNNPINNFLILDSHAIIYKPTQLTLF